MYCVVAFYLELKEEPALKRNNPLMKLTCIKLVIFLIFWQSILLQLLAVAGIIKDRNEYWSARDIQTGLNALATCVEMAIFAVLHISAFTYKVYIPEDKTKTTYRWKLVVDAFNFLDFVREFTKACKWVFSDRKRFDPDGFDIESDDAIYNELRLKRLRKCKAKPHSMSVAIPMLGHIVDPVLLRPEPVSISNRSVVPSRKDQERNSSFSVDETDGLAAAYPSYPSPKLRVLQTRTRSPSVSNSSPRHSFPDKPYY